MADDSTRSGIPTMSQPLTMPPTTTQMSSNDFSALLQHIQQQQQQQTPQVPTSNQPTSGDMISLMAQMQNLGQMAPQTSSASSQVPPFNPLSMFALTTLQQPMACNPLYSNLAKMLLTMNMGQLLANQQTTELLAALTQQQESLIAAFSSGNLPFQHLLAAAVPQPQVQPPPSVQVPTFALPQNPGPASSAHMSLKRNSSSVLSTPSVDRKRSCPAPNLGQQTSLRHSVTHSPAPRPAKLATPRRSPSPDIKKWMDNLTTEQKQQNEKFRVEILRRLDVILLEELGTDCEEDKKKQLKAEPEDVEVDSESATAPVTTNEDSNEATEEDLTTEKEKSSSEKSKSEASSPTPPMLLGTTMDTVSATDGEMGTPGSAFRRVLSRGSTNNESNSKSGSATPSLSEASSSSSASSPRSPIEALPADLLQRIAEVARKYPSSTSQDDSVIPEDVLFNEKHPLAWTGHLSMKGNETMLNLHFVSGNIECMRGWFGPSPPIPDVPRRDVIRINQRLRLDPSQIGKNILDILRRMQTMDFVCLVGMCAGADREDIVNNTAMLQENFVNYFNNKGIAGIANLNEGPCLPVRVHVFPPCEFSEQYLSQNAPGLYNHLTQKHFQFVFIVATPSE